jgi:uncharacterized protein
MVSVSFENLPVRTLASGNVLHIPVYRFKGGPGKKVYIQANIHGPEVAGIPAAYRLVELLKEQEIIHGSVTVVPSINPVALDLKVNGLSVGYADPNEYTVGNFNRIYQMLVKNKPAEETPPDPTLPQKVVLEDFVSAHLASDPAVIVADFKAELMKALSDLKAKKGRTGLRFGLQLALTVQEMAQDADLIVDLHTDARAIYYGYSFEQTIPSFHIFDIPYLILVSPDDFDGVFDEAFLIPWVKLQRAFKKAGRELEWQDLDQEAITLELGSAETIDRARVEEDAQRMLNYLRHKGVLPGTVRPPTQPLYRCEFTDRDNYYAPAGGLLYWHKQPGDAVETGDTVATILQLAAASPQGQTSELAVKASEPGVLINISRSQVVHQGIQIFSILTHLKKVA